MTNSDVFLMIFSIISVIACVVCGIISIVKSENSGDFMEGIMIIICGLTVFPAIVIVGIAIPFLMMIGFGMFCEWLFKKVKPNHES